MDQIEVRTLLHASRRPSCRQVKVCDRNLEKLRFFFLEQFFYLVFQAFFVGIEIDFDSGNTGFHSGLSDRG